MNRETIKELPKIELHCHLDGSVRPHILAEIAETQGVTLPYEEDALAEAMSAPVETESLAEYLKCFDVVLPLLQQVEALELVAYDLIAQVSEENVRYIEVRYAPMLFTHQGLSLSEIINAVTAGIKRGEESFNVKANTLLCGMRHHTPAQNKEVVAAVKEHLGKGVVGFDLAGDEASFPTKEFAEIITLANEQNLPLTLHAGECGCPHNVRESIELGATRIGHGIAIHKDDDLLKKCVAEEVIVEMCPTSNLQTKAVPSLADYPFEKFLDAGLKICLNTDNRTVSNTTLTDEYLKLSQWYGITYQTMATFNHNAVDGAFITSSEKNNLHEMLTTAYAPYH